MRTLILIATSAMIGVAIPAGAQQLAVLLPMQSPPPTAVANYATSAEIKAMIERARRDIKPGQPLLLQPIQNFGPYTTFLEYRRGAWTAAIHSDIELFFVVQGSGTLILGGTLLDRKEGTGGNSSGSGIVGGATYKVGPGDLFFVPQDTAHQFPAPVGELVLISMHIPRAEPKHGP